MTTVRIDRLNSIVGALLECGGVGGCSRAEIASMLKKADGTPLKKSPYLNGLLDQLVADGLATVTEDLSSWPRKYRYSPTQKLLDMQKAVA